MPISRSISTPTYVYSQQPDLRDVPCVKHDSARCVGKCTDQEEHSGLFPRD